MTKEQEDYLKIWSNYIQIQTCCLIAELVLETIFNAKSIDKLTLYCRKNNEVVIP